MEIATKSIPDRIRALEPYLPGRWAASDVCRAFMVPMTAMKLVPADHKYRYWIDSMDWRFRRCIYLLDREGIEYIALRHGRQYSRHEIMEALDGQQHHDA